ncbi:MAG: EamA family transporter [Phycisphaerae bacterium]|nr:EamA family transporter [Phycisphaerae bacterium]
MSIRAPSIRLLVAFAAVYLIWGSTYFGMKVAVQTIPPILLGGIRFTLAGAALLALQAATGRVRAEWLTNARFWGAAALTGGLMLLGANGLLAWSLRSISSGTAAIVVAFTPVWLVLFDRIQRRQGAPPIRVIAGLAIGALGVALLAGVGPGSAKPSFEESVGIAIVTGSTLCWALGSILGRRTPGPPALLVGASMQMIAGGALMLLASAALAPWTPFSWSAVPWSGWIAVAYLAVAGSMLAYSAYVWLLRNTSAARVATYAYVNPLVAVLLGWLFLDEWPSTRLLVAGPLILAAVVLLQSVRERGAVRTVAHEHPEATEAESAPRAELTPRSTSRAGDAR